MEALKRQLEEINWFRLGLQLLLGMIALFGMIWGFAETKGNTLWAPNEKTSAEIQALRDKAIRGETQIAKLSSELEELRSETQDSFQKARREQAEFWAEQRAVNREILQRLPPK